MGRLIHAIFGVNARNTFRENSLATRTTTKKKINKASQI